MHPAQPLLSMHPSLHPAEFSNRNEMRVHDKPKNKRMYKNIVMSHKMINIKSKMNKNQA